LRAVRARERVAPERSNAFLAGALDTVRIRSRRLASSEAIDAYVDRLTDHHIRP